MHFLRAFVAATAAVALLGADAPKPLEIDVVLSMTGPSTFVGKIDHDVLSVLETTVNKDGGVRGRSIRFVFHDDRSDPQAAVQLANEVLSKHPSIFLGSSSGAACHAMAPLSAASGPVQYCLSPAIHPTRGSYVFSSSMSTPDDLRAVIRFFRESGWKRIGVLTGTDVGGQDIDANLISLLALPENKAAGLEIVSHEHFNLTDLTVRAQLTRIKSMQPQVAILWTSGTPFATVLRDAATIGLDVPVVGSSANMTDQQMKQYASFLPKEMLFPGPAFLAHVAASRRAGAVQRQYFDALTAAGLPPDFVSSTAWDPGLITITALRSLGPTATAEQVRAYIAGLHGFSGISGEYDFRTSSERGLTDKNVIILQWDGDKKTWIARSELGGKPLR
jgi:branched-chain amino acid transport system substrate-binding protein